MKRVCSTGALVFALALPICLLPANAAQSRRGAPAKPPPPPKISKQPRAERPLEHLQQMKPADREKALSHLPPERRAAIEQRLNRLDKLPPAQRERLQSQLNRFSTLPPERQQAVRKAAANLQKMPDDRRQTVRDELRAMGGLTAEDREARLQSPEFKDKFNKHEQKIIQELKDVVPQ